MPPSSSTMPILVRTPHYYRKQMRNREMLTYYQAVADRSPLPVLLYSVPSCTAYDLPVEVVAELAMHPNIVGMKDSSGNVERIAELVQATRSARKRTVTVTTVFAAVTSRMLSPQTAQTREKRATFVAAGAACFRRHGSWRWRRLGLRSRRVPRKWVSSCFAVLPRRSIPRSKPEPRVVCWRSQRFAPQACCEVYTAWAEKDRSAGGGKAGADCPGGNRDCRQDGDSRREVCAGPERLLRRTAENAAAALHRG